MLTRWRAIGCGLLISACGSPGEAAPPTSPTAAEEPSRPAEVAVPEVEPEQAEDQPAPTKPAVVLDVPGWASFQGGSTRTGYAAKAPEIRQPKVLWKAQVGVQGYLNSPLVIGSIAVVPSSGDLHNEPDPRDGLHALDLDSGQSVWHVESTRDANGAAATEKLAVFTSDDGRARAVELQTGKVVWDVEVTKEKLYSAPVLTQDAAIVGDGAGSIYSLKLSDGSTTWKKRFAGAIRGGLAADGATLFVVSQGGEVAALDFNGTEKWKKVINRPPFGGRGRPVRIEGFAPPTVDGNQLIVGFARDTYYKDVPALLALDTSSGRELWRARGPEDYGNLRSSPLVAHGRVVWAEPYSGDVLFADSKNGRVLSRKKIAPCFFPQYASPAGAGKVAYVPRFGGHVYALALPSGSLLWELYLGDSGVAGKGTPGALRNQKNCSWDVPSGWPLFSPAAVAPNGTLLVGSGEGYLYAVGNR